MQVLLDLPAEPHVASARLAGKSVGSMSRKSCMAIALGSENCCFFEGLKLGSTDSHKNSFAKLKSCCFSCLGLQRG